MKLVLALASATLIAPMSAAPASGVGKPLYGD